LAIASMMRSSTRLFSQYLKEKETHIALIRLISMHFTKLIFTYLSW
jgi:hypothetical protein